eukprot:scaffold11552_cov76-Skeletonema_dohrnii-CCMP3373.AAC.3
MEHSSREIPQVTYDMAKIEFWEHGQTEIDFFLRKIYSSREIYGQTEDLDNVVALLCDQTVTCTKRSEG